MTIFKFGSLSDFLLLPHTSLGHFFFSVSGWSRNKVKLIALGKDIVYEINLLLHRSYFKAKFVSFRLSKTLPASFLISPDN